MSAPAVQFKQDATRLSADLRHRRIIQTAMGKYETVRDQRKAAFQNWEEARQLAAITKWEAINHLDAYLEQLVSKLESRGTKVHWATTARQARDTILGVLRAAKARVIVKSKAMTAEEIHLNQALEQAGFEVVESDLGEFIVQLREEPPYHIVFPAMHLTRDEIKEVFDRKLGDAPSNDPEQLTMVARRVLREKYLQADAGITGANFAIAETGMISITENEGNARLTSALPRVMITLIGIEKVLPRLEDLALFLPMLAAMGTGQTVTCYNTLYGGPRQPGEPDGPEEYHVVLVDNGRSATLGGPFNDMLRCIRCGACMNHCPVYHAVGGHAYGWVYPGPMGAVLTPLLIGVAEGGHLPNASTLCGRCEAVCPVRIPLPKLMRLWREREFVRGLTPPAARAGLRLWAFFAKRPTLYRFATDLAMRALALVGRRRGRFGWLLLAGGWTRWRDFPTPQGASFQSRWRAKSGPTQ